MIYQLKIKVSVQLLSGYCTHIWVHLPSLYIFSVHYIPSHGLALGSYRPIGFCFATGPSQNILVHSEDATRWKLFLQSLRFCTSWVPTGRQQRTSEVSGFMLMWLYGLHILSHCCSSAQGRSWIWQVNDLNVYSRLYQIPLNSKTLYPSIIQPLYTHSHTDGGELLLEPQFENSRLLPKPILLGSNSGVLILS